MTPDKHATSEIPVGVLCIGCRYDLGGLAPQGNCPECDTPVRSSLEPHLLTNAPTVFLLKLRNSARIIVAALTVIAITFCITTANNLLTPTQTYNPQPHFTFQQNRPTSPLHHHSPSPFHHHQTPSPFAHQQTPQPQSGLHGFVNLQKFNALTYAIGIIDTFAYLALLIAWRRFTDPLSGTSNTTGEIPRRRAARFWTTTLLTFAVVVSSTVLLITPSLPAYSAHYQSPLALLIIPVVIFLFIGFILMLVYSMLYCKHIALRLQEKPIANFAAYLAWISPIITIVGSCIIIGPLVAHIFTIILFTKLQGSINQIIARREVDNHAGAPASHPNNA